MGADGFGLFRRACTRAGLFGFLVAFMAGFLVYGSALTAGTLVLKWAIIGRAKAGVHKYASCAHDIKIPILFACGKFPWWHDFPQCSQTCNGSFDQRRAW